MHSSAVRTYSGSGSVSRKLPPARYRTSRRRSWAASIMPTAVMPGIVGGRKPQIFANRSAFSSSTGKPRPNAAGCAPISEPPWTPLWPRIGMRPHFSRPTIPRASPRFTIDLTLSTPNRWGVMPMLPHRIHDRDPGALLLRIVQIFHRHGLVVRHIGAEEDDQIAADPIRVRACGGRDPDRVLESRGAWRMARPARVVDVVRPEEPRDFVRYVIRLVRHPA